MNATTPILGLWGNPAAPLPLRAGRGGPSRTVRLVGAVPIAAGGGGQPPTAAADRGTARRPVVTPDETTCEWPPPTARPRSPTAAAPQALAPAGRCPPAPRYSGRGARESGDHASAVRQGPAPSGAPRRREAERPVQHPGPTQPYGTRPVRSVAVVADDLTIAGDGAVPCSRPGSRRASCCARPVGRLPGIRTVRAGTARPAVAALTTRTARTAVFPAAVPPASPRSTSTPAPARPRGPPPPPQARCDGSRGRRPAEDGGLDRARPPRRGAGGRARRIRTAHRGRRTRLPRRGAGDRARRAAPAGTPGPRRPSRAIPATPCGTPTCPRCWRPSASRARAGGRMRSPDSSNAPAWWWRRRRGPGPRPDRRGRARSAGGAVGKVARARQRARPPPRPARGRRARGAGARGARRGGPGASGRPRGAASCTSSAR